MARWVGKYYEKVLVFDIAWKSDLSNFVLFWDVTDLCFSLYPASMARRRIRKANSTVASDAIARFEQWINEQGSGLVELVQLRREAKFCGMSKDMTLAELHEKHVAELRIPYRGSAQITASPFRRVNCWACKQEISTLDNIQCVACEWILCTCGACGCGRSSIIAKAIKSVN